MSTRKTKETKKSKQPVDLHVQLEAIKLIKKGHPTTLVIKKLKLNAAPSVVRRWMKRADAIEECVKKSTPLVIMRKKKILMPNQVKLDAIAKVESGISTTIVAKELNVDPVVVRRWRYKKKELLEYQAIRNKAIELKNMKEKEKPVDIRVQLNAIADLEKGIPVSVIAEKLNVNPMAVLNWPNRADDLKKKLQAELDETMNKEKEKPVDKISSQQKELAKKIKTLVSVHVKLNAVADVRKGIDPRKVAKKFNVHQDAVKKWVKEADLLDARLNKEKSLKESINNRVDLATWRWYQKKIEASEYVSDEDIISQALEFYERLGRCEKNFTASEEWLKQWKIHHDIVEPQRKWKLKRVIAQYIEDNNLVMDQVFTLSETELYYKMMPKNSLPGNSDVEHRVRIMICSNASGTCKLPLVVTGKYPRLRETNNISCIPSSFGNQENAWHSGELFAEWFHEEFISKVVEFLKLKRLDRKAVLFLDECPAHSNKYTKDGISVIFLPKMDGMIVQPMNRGVVQYFTLLYRRRLMMFLLNHLKQGKNLAESLEIISKSSVILWIANAWEQVSVMTILKAWKGIWPNSFTILQFLGDHEIDLTELDELTSEFSGFLTKNESFKNLQRSDIDEWLKIPPKISKQEREKKNIAETVTNRSIDSDGKKDAGVPKLKKKVTFHSQKTCSYFLGEAHIKEKEGSISLPPAKKLKKNSDVSKH